MIFAAFDRWRRPLRAHSNSSACAAKYLRPGKRYDAFTVRCAETSPRIPNAAQSMRSVSKFDRSVK